MLVAGQGNPKQGAKLATIYQRANGKWTAQVRRGGRLHSNTFSTRALAEKWARGVESDIERGRITGEDEAARRTTVAEAVERYIGERVEGRSHARRDQNRLNALLTATGWGALPLPTLRPAAISNYTRERTAAGCRPDTVRLDLAALSAVYQHAITEWGMDIDNPCRRVRRPSLTGTGRDRRLKPGEWGRLMEAASDAFRPVLQWAVETAMRREEIARLTWEHVDMERGTAHLPRTKNGEARTVPLSAAALDVLRGLPTYSPEAKKRSGAVFGVTPDRLTKWMAVTTVKAGVEDMRFHDLRHEATSRLFELGLFNVLEIARITGHKTLSMLSRYTHLDPAALARKLRGET